MCMSCLRSVSGMYVCMIDKLVDVKKRQMVASDQSVMQGAMGNMRYRSMLVVICIFICSPIETCL